MVNRPRLQTILSIMTAHPFSPRVEVPVSQRPPPPSFDWDTTTKGHKNEIQKSFSIINSANYMPKSWLSSPASLLKDDEYFLSFFPPFSTKECSEIGNAQPFNSPSSHHQHRLFASPPQTHAISDLRKFYISKNWANYPNCHDLYDYMRYNYCTLLCWRI